MKSEFKLSTNFEPERYTYILMIVASCKKGIISRKIISLCLVMIKKKVERGGGEYSIISLVHSFQLTFNYKF